MKLFDWLGIEAAVIGWDGKEDEKEEKMEGGKWLKEGGNSGKSSLQRCSEWSRSFVGRSP